MVVMLGDMMVGKSNGYSGGYGDNYCDGEKWRKVVVRPMIGWRLCWWLWWWGAYSGGEEVVVMLV